MARNKKGSDFERVIADWLKATWSRYIDRRVKTGAKDKGDIANFYIHDHEIVIECKNEANIKVGTDVAEAQREAVNAGALAGIVVHKRAGKAAAEHQYVFCTLGDFLNIVRAAQDPDWRPPTQSPDQCAIPGI
jgi:hypothetical protein